MPQEPRAPYDFNRVKSINATDMDGPKWLDTAEKIEVLAFIAPNPKDYGGRYTKAIEARIFVNKSGTKNMAAIWAHSRDGEIYLHGFGDAGGGGYHRPSAALDQAIGNAGIELERHFGGAGDGCMVEAIKAIAKRLGWKTGEVMKF